MAYTIHCTSLGFISIFGRNGNQTKLTKFLSDRDSARWDLPTKEVERRQVLLWNLFVADSWNVCLSILDLSNLLNMTSNPTEHDRGGTSKQQLREFFLVVRSTSS